MLIVLRILCVLYFLHCLLRIWLEFRGQDATLGLHRYYIIRGIGSIIVFVSSFFTRITVGKTQLAISKPELLIGTTAVLVIGLIDYIFSKINKKREWRILDKVPFVIFCTIITITATIFEPVSFVLLLIHCEIVLLIMDMTFDCVRDAVNCQLFNDDYQHVPNLIKILVLWLIYFCCVIKQALTIEISVIAFRIAVIISCICTILTLIVDKSNYNKFRDCYEGDKLGCKNDILMLVGLAAAFVISLY